MPRPKRATGSIYKVRWARYVDADGKRCKKSDPGATLMHVESETYFGTYTDERGERRQMALETDLETSREKLAAKSKEQKALRKGDRSAVERERPLVEHLAGFRSYLAGKENTAKHVANTINRVQEMIDECRFFLVDHVSASAFQKWLASKRQKKKGPQRTRPLPKKTQAERPVLMPLLSAKTRNYYLRDCKAFFKWLVEDRRIDERDNRLAYLKPVGEHNDDPRERRALSDTEFVRFVSAAEKSGKSFCDLAGADRAMIYILAAYTGFRAGELASLTPDRFEFAPPDSGRLSIVRLRANASKRRNADEQPLRADVAERMRDYLDGRQIAAGQPIWDKRWANVAAEMVQLDLAAAGLPYQNADGCYFDFHALRGQFCTWLANAGTHPARVQRLARHSDINLTMKRYTRPALVDIAGELDGLPALPSNPPEQAAQRATGTHGRIDHARGHSSPEALRKSQSREAGAGSLAEVSSERPEVLARRLARRAGGKASHTVSDEARVERENSGTLNGANSTVSWTLAGDGNEAAQSGDDQSPAPVADLSDCKSATVGSTPTSASSFPVNDLRRSEKRDGERGKALGLKNRLDSEIEAFLELIEAGERLKAPDWQALIAKLLGLLQVLNSQGPASESRRAPPPPQAVALRRAEANRRLKEPRQRPGSETGGAEAAG